MSYRRTITILLASFSWCTEIRPGVAAGKPAAHAGASAQVQVKAIVLHRTVTANLAIETVEDNKSIIIRVKNGALPYTVTLQNPDLARVTQIDDTTFRVTGVLEGKSVMVIRDSGSGRISCDLQVGTCLIAP